MTTFEQISLILAVIIGTSAFVLGGFWILSKLAYRLYIGSKAGASMIRKNAQHTAALLAPDFDGFRAHYGIPIPAELRLLYAEHGILTSTGFCFMGEDGDEHYVERFLPMTTDDFEFCDSFVGPARFAIAADDFGNYYFVDLENNKLYLLDHDGGESYLVCSSVGVFRKIAAAATRTMPRSPS